MKSNIKNIVISGGISTGKSTLAKNLAKHLGWDYLSAGEFVRNWYKENNLPLEMSDHIPEEMDRRIEAEFREKMESDEGAVFESHLGGYQARGITHTLKVLVDADFETKLKRFKKRDGVDLKTARKQMNEREDSLQKKFQKLYGVKNRFDPKYFDLIVDTTTKTPEEVMEVVLKKMSTK